MCCNVRIKGVHKNRLANVLSLLGTARSAPSAGRLKHWGLNSIALCPVWSKGRVCKGLTSCVNPPPPSWNFTADSIAGTEFFWLFSFSRSENVENPYFNQTNQIPCEVATVIIKRKWNAGGKNKDARCLSGISKDFQAVGPPPPLTNVCVTSFPWTVGMIPGSLNCKDQNSFLRCFPATSQGRWRDRRCYRQPKPPDFSLRSSFDHRRVPVPRFLSFIVLEKNLLVL